MLWYVFSAQHVWICRFRPKKKIFFSTILISLSVNCHIFFFSLVCIVVNVWRIKKNYRKNSCFILPFNLVRAEIKKKREKNAPRPFLSAQALKPEHNSRVIASNRLTMALIAPMVFRYFTISDRWMHRVNYKIFLSTAFFVCFVWKKKRKKITQKNSETMLDLDDMNAVTRGNVHMFHLCRWPFAWRFMQSNSSSRRRGIAPHSLCYKLINKSFSSEKKMPFNGLLSFATIVKCCATKWATCKWNDWRHGFFPFFLFFRFVLGRLNHQWGRKKTA